MVFDLDPFGDPEPKSNARAGAKFQPRAKIRPKKDISIISNSVEKSFTTSSLHDVSREKPGTPPFCLAASTQTIPAVDASDKILTQSGPSYVDAYDTTTYSSFKLSESHDVVDNTEDSHSAALLPAVNRSSVPVDLSTQLVDSRKHLGTTDILHSEATVSDNHEDWHSGFGRSRGETADIFFEWEDFDSFLSQTTTEADPVTCEEAAISNDNEEDLPTDIGRSKNVEAKSFSCLETLEYVSEAITTTDNIPKVSVVEELTHPVVTSNLDSEFSGDFVDSRNVSVISGEVCNDIRSKTPAIPENKTGTVHSTVEELSSWANNEGPVPGIVDESEAVKPRQLRKRVAVSVPADGLQNETEKHEGLLAEPTNDSVMDDDDDNNDDGDDDYDDDDEYHGKTASHRKRASKKSKPHMAGNEKPIRRCKRAAEVQDHRLNKETTRKKFSHSTRRNRRRVDKVLLETPDDEVDPKKLVIKDLILLAEAKERILNKEAAAKKTVPNQSVDNPFSNDAAYEEEETFFSKQGFNSDEDQDANPRFEESATKINYQSFMDKQPKERWSKQDTELFYEAIRQFGTDFAMIQQLFPGRTRRQVKLKYKKEERQQPLRLSDALSNRSKDHSHFELVIERLKQAAAQAEQNSEKDVESTDVMSEEATLETNVEVAKPEEKQEEVAKEMEGDVPDVQGPVKSNESEDENLYDIWSQYKSEL